MRTPVIDSSDVTIGLGQVREDVNDRIKELQAGIDGLADRLASLADGFSLEGFVGHVERRSLRSAVGNVSAEVAEETRVRVSSTEAIAQQIGTVSAAVGTVNALVATERTASVERDQALAQDLNLVRAEMGDVLADGYLSITAQTTGDFLSRVEFAARAQKGNMTGLASMIMRVIEEGGVLKSETIHVANRTIFVDENGQNGQAIATFGPEGLTLAVVNVDRIKTGLIGGDNGKMVINVKAGTIVISS